MKIKVLVVLTLLAVSGCSGPINLGGTIQDSSASAAFGILGPVTIVGITINAQLLGFLAFLAVICLLFLVVRGKQQ